MASFLPTREALVRLAWLTGREPSDQAVVELFIGWCCAAT
jgi:hypothetical protein